MNKVPACGAYAREFNVSFERSYNRAYQSSEKSVVEQSYFVPCMI